MIKIAALTEIPDEFRMAFKEKETANVRYGGML